MIGSPWAALYFFYINMIEIFGYSDNRVPCISCSKHMIAAL